MEVEPKAPTPKGPGKESQKPAKSAEGEKKLLAELDQALSAKPPAPPAAKPPTPLTPGKGPVKQKQDSTASMLMHFASVAQSLADNSTPQGGAKPANPAPPVPKAPPVPQAAHLVPSSAAKPARTPATGAAPGVKKRKRVRGSACAHCHARKLRCEEVRPCFRCKKHKIPCVPRSAGAPGYNKAPARKQQKQEAGSSGDVKSNPMAPNSTASSALASNAKGAGSSGGARATVIRRLSDSLNPNWGVRCYRNPQCTRPNLHPGHCKIRPPTTGLLPTSMLPTTVTCIQGRGGRPSAAATTIAAQAVPRAIQLAGQAGVVHTAQALPVAPGSVSALPVQPILLPATAAFPVPQAHPTPIPQAAAVRKLANAAQSKQNNPHLARPHTQQPQQRQTAPQIAQAVLHHASPVQAVELVTHPHPRVLLAKPSLQPPSPQPQRSPPLPPPPRPQPQPSKPSATPAAPPKQLQQPPVASPTPTPTQPAKPDTKTAVPMETEATVSKPSPAVMPPKVEQTPSAPKKDKEARKEKPAVEAGLMPSSGQQQKQQPQQQTQQHVAKQLLSAAQ